MNRHAWIRGTLAAALLALGALPARALTVETQITPGTLDQGSRRFQVQVRDRERDKVFTITVTVPAKERKLSPFLFGDLDLIGADSHLAYVRVEPERTENTAKYRFRVAPETLANSRFTFRENAWSNVKEPDGRSHPQILVGGVEYWFRLGDFVPVKQP